MVEQTLWTSYTPSAPDANDSQQYALGTTFYADASGWVLGVRWRFPDTLPSGSVTAKLWRTDGDDQLVASGVELASATFSAPTAGAVNEVRFGTPIAISANQDHVVSIKTPDRYVATSGYTPFASGGGVNSGNLHAPQHGTDPIGVGTLHNGKLNDLTGHQYPHQTFSTGNYWVDVIFTTDDPTGTPKSSDDTGTLSDGQTLAVTASDTDTGAGTEAQSLSALMASSETAVLSEMQTLLAGGASSDSGALTESFALVVMLSDADTGAITDGQGALNVLSSESGILTETQLLTVTLTSADSASFIDAGFRTVEGEEGSIPQVPITITRRAPAITVRRRPPGITIRG